MKKTTAVILVILLLMPVASAGYIYSSYGFREIQPSYFYLLEDGYTRCSLVSQINETVTVTEIRFIGQRENKSCKKTLTQELTKKRGMELELTGCESYKTNLIEQLLHYTPTVTFTVEIDYLSEGQTKTSKGTLTMPVEQEKTFCWNLGTLLIIALIPPLLITLLLLENPYILPLTLLAILAYWIKNRKNKKAILKLLKLITILILTIIIFSFLAHHMGAFSV